jgi:hypothetical protein
MYHKLGKNWSVFNFNRSFVLLADVCLFESSCGFPLFSAWRVARLYSGIALSRKPFGIEHMYIYTLLLRMTDTMTCQNIDISSWDTVCSSSGQKGDK